MTTRGISTSWWEQVKEEGLVSILGKLFFMLLIYGLLVLLIFEKEGGGLDWIMARIPIFEAVRHVSFVGPYIFWLISLWVGFNFGKRVGMSRDPVRERNRMGIPY